MGLKTGGHVMKNALGNRGEHPRGAAKPGHMSKGKGHRISYGVTPRAIFKITPGRGNLECRVTDRLQVCGEYKQQARAQLQAYVIPH